MINGNAHSYPIGGLIENVCAGIHNTVWGADINGLVWKIHTSGTAISYPLTGSSLWDIVSTPDGNVWATDLNGAVWQITTDGIGTPYKATATQALCVGPDNNIWSVGNQTVNQFTPNGKRSTYILPVDGLPQNIITGPDGNLYIAIRNNSTYNSYLLKLTPAGSFDIVVNLSDAQFYQ